jgi:hypothetical protein
MKSFDQPGASGNIGQAALASMAFLTMSGITNL